MPIERPVHEMMLALDKHFVMKWSVEIVESSLLAEVQPHQIADFLVCHHGGHRACPKKTVNLICYEATILASVLAYVHHGRQGQPEIGWSDRWRSSRLYKELSVTFAASNSVAKHHLALQAFLRCFEQAWTLHLELYDHKIQHIQQAALNDGRWGDAPLNQAHAFPVDCVVALEIYAVDLERDHQKLLSHHLPSRELLATVRHAGVVEQPNSSDALRSSVLGLRHDGLFTEPL
jgi:hypothetical protein